jgi:hypothetical protein
LAFRLGILIYDNIYAKSREIKRILRLELPLTAAITGSDILRPPVPISASGAENGTGTGQFDMPRAIAVTSGFVFTVELANNRVHYSTATGSHLGIWGTKGSGAGEFNYPWGIEVTRDGGRVYTVEMYNRRVQYSCEDEEAVTPTSWGQVKALFR